ncbi:MAG TPA: hypothetical protein VLL73_03550, partial [Desulfurivibrionaceae bacterium]|nr:hypothetical protein [Desulfurivibrionaceae bacterium]
LGFCQITRQSMVVIAANDNLVPVRQAPQEVVEVRHIPRGSAVGHVAGKDENIGLRENDLPFRGVGITEQSKFHAKRRVKIFCGSGRQASYKNGAGL